MITTKLYFLHIPKTAGTTFRWIFYNRLSNNELFIFHPFTAKKDIEKAKNMSAERFRKIEVIVGPFSFGFHNEFHLHSFNYYTFLRDPVARFVSEYYYILNEIKHPLYQKFISEKTTIEEFIQICGDNNNFNSQMKMIAGEGNFESDTECYNKAIDNIKSFFPVIGITEKFNESLFLFSQFYSINWKNLRYVSRNVNNSVNKKAEISEKTILRITELNSFDMDLYNFCKNRLEEQLKDFSHYALPSFAISSSLKKHLYYINGRLNMFLRNSFR